MSSRPSAYDEVIQYLYDRLPSYQRIGDKAFKKDLGNTRALCSVLGDPHLQFRSVHIAGTNGKGSVTNMLASVFMEAGYRTGVYTSPHISDFRERIQVDGAMIDKNSVIRFVKRIKPHIDDISPSFFELTVAMAFDHFRRKKVDVAIVETGLGGRLDSTNVILPELSVITNIGLDHQAMLGDTHRQIAGEKAGIIKDNTPVVIGKTQSSTSAVFRKHAAEHNSPVIWADKAYTTVSSVYLDKYRSLKVLKTADGRVRDYKLDLAAEYQIENAITVLSAVDAINEGGKFYIGQAAVRRGLQSATKNNYFRGRWQVIGKQPKIVADGSHNADGIRKAMKQLKDERYRKLHIIFGCVSDKDLEKIVPLLPGNALYYLTKPDLERGRDVQSLEQAFLLHKRHIEHISEDPSQCLKAAIQTADKSDLILITGSIFLLSSFL